MEALLARASAEATEDPRCARRLQGHLHAALLCPERTTVTNLIRMNGAAQADWSADYRLYSQDRVEEQALFGVALRELLAELPEDRPLVVALDDTLLRKTGPRIDGVGWRRDPLGPPFQVNLVRAQRGLQMSAAWPLANGAARMVPIAFQHAPSAAKPPRDATPEQRAAHRQHQREHSLTAYAGAQMRALRRAVPASRRLVFCGDGGYTNAEVLGQLPEGACYLGRTRRDAALFHPPPPPDPAAPRQGRPRRYGDPAPTPEQLRADDRVPWQQVQAFASGRLHTFRVKSMDNLQWKNTGPDRRLRLIVIAPTSYRLRKGSKLLYRQPAYLLCTDPDLPLDQLLQFYLWRWGIEVNFREEKTDLGVGDAQVRTPASNRHLPAVMVAAYALLWTAVLRLHARGKLPKLLDPPRWLRESSSARPLPSTVRLLAQLRFEHWGSSVAPPTFGDFVSGPPPVANDTKLNPQTKEGLLHAG